MNTSQREKRLFLVGPTGSGKSEVAIRLAQEMAVELLALDSMKVYREADIGTATPDEDRRKSIRYHFLNIKEPHESFSVADYIHLAEKREEAIRQRDHLPLYTGGTAMYMKRLVHGLFEGPEADWDLRETLKEKAAEEGRAHLHRQLAEVDPERAEEIHPNDLRRVVRALEVYKKTGRPMSELIRESKEEAQKVDNRIIVLHWPREVLYKRINKRVDRMIERGWLDETRQLLQREPAPGKHIMQAAGYRVLVRFIQGEINLEEAIEQIRTEHRNLAKKQLTSFRNLNYPVYEVDPSEFEDLSEVAEQVRTHFQNWPPNPEHQLTESGSSG